MLLGWIAASAVQHQRGLRAWVPLAAAASFVLIKRVDGAPWLRVLVLLMLAGAGADWARRRRPWISSRLLAGITFPVLAGTWIVMAARWHSEAHTSRRPALDADRPLLCVGDSLAAKGFPRRLPGRVKMPVVDLAFPGITAAEGRELLAEGLRFRPLAVVIELGGHDFLKGRSRAETMSELEAMIHACRAAGAEPILFEIPRGVVMDGFGGLERELARRHDVELIGDGAIRQLIFFSPLTPLSWTGRTLSNDGLHPNDRGHEFLAGRIVDALVRIYGSAILRDP